MSIMNECAMCGGKDIREQELDMPVRVENSPIKSGRVLGWKCKNASCGEEFYSQETMKVMESIRRTLKQMQI